MATIAFASIGSTAHMYKLLSVARELVDRGESVVYLAPEYARSIVEAAGVRCEPYPGDRSSIRCLDAFNLGVIPEMIARDCVNVLPFLVQALGKVAPDVLAYDAFTVAARLAGEVRRLPMVRMSTSYANADRVNYLTSIGDVRLRGTMSSPVSLQRYEERMGWLFKCYGLRHRSFLDLMVEPAELEIVFVSRTFHPHAGEYGPDVVFVGPGFSRTSRAPLAGNDLARGDKRWLIYVSLGTSYNYQPAFFYSCLEAFAHLDARVILSVGDAFPADYWVGVPDNVSIHSFVPQLDVLADADLFVTCGGMGSVMEALSFGVPMLLVPQQPEQMMSALRADNLGAGIFHDREEVSIRSLRAAATRILTEPSFRQRAQELGDAGRQDGGFRRAADCIQNFVAQHGKRPGATPQAGRQIEVAAQQTLQDLGVLSDDQVDALLARLLDTKGGTT